MRATFCKALVSGVLVSVLPWSGTAEDGLNLPLPVPQERSAATARLSKTVVETRPLDDMERPEGWSGFGPGAMSFTEERARNGRRSVRWTSPTKLDRPGPVLGRPFGETGVRRAFPGEDWTPFNRLSFQVFPHLPGFRTISLLIKFRAQGSESWPYTFGHLHHVLLQADTWNHVVWEIPHLPRTQVTGLDFVYRLQGNERGATETVQFDLDDLRLERVDEPDPWRGWEVAPGRLAYNHLGYRNGARKVAVAAAPGSSGGNLGFSVERVGGESGEGPDAGTAKGSGAGAGPMAYQGVVQVWTNGLGRFAVLDFSDLRTSGSYRLRYGSTMSRPFRIGDGVWDEARRATVNQYRCQRCGEAVPGIHEACHLDWQVKHGTARIPIHGGWHDAGDLSQGLVNTGEATLALLDAAQRLTGRQGTESGRLAREARWGMEWLLRTRFGDGHRLGWATMDFWTDGVLGNADDVVVEAGDSALDNFIAARAGARAARWFRESDPIFAAIAGRTAREDWSFALGRMRSPNTELASAAIRAAVELHRWDPRDEYRERAAEWARGLLAAQQAEPIPTWKVPLAGFFHTGPDRRRPLTYPHRGHHDGPVVALVEMVEAFPSHAEAGEWRQGVRRHAEYLRATTAFTAPWCFPAAGLYRASDADPGAAAQIREGIEVGEGWYLRRFPVWGEMRGNSGVLLSQARALSAAARLLQDEELAALAETQLEWHLGRNPFGQSLMYGVGHAFTPQYSAMSGDLTGGLPVGIQTRGAEDVPYWPAANCYNYAEIWVHPSTRFLEVWSDLEVYASEGARGPDKQ